MRLAAAAISLSWVTVLSPDSIDFPQARLRRMNDFRERTEFLDQRLGQRLDVAARAGAEQHHLQQLVIAQGVGSGAMKAIAQPLPMAVIMRGFGGLIVWFAGLRGHRRNMPCRSVFAISNCQMTAWPRGKSGRYRRLFSRAVRPPGEFGARRRRADPMRAMQRHPTVAPCRR